MINKENHGLLSGGQAVVEIFKSKSTKNVFGLIGSSTMELFDALFNNREINFIDVEMRELELIWLMVIQEHQVKPE